MILFNTRKSIAETEFLANIEDCHSHVLPGVDDGVPTTEESLETLEQMERAGLKRLWLTPHIMEDMPNRPEELKKVFENLKASYKGEIELHLAAENMLDPLFEQRLNSGELLPIGKERDKLLVETSYFSAPISFLDMLDQIKKSGLRPVLAHPERYVYMDDEMYRRLKTMDILFQVNYTSFTGFYGDTARSKAIKLLDAGYLDYCGGDTHKIKHFEHAIEKKTINKSLGRRILETFSNKTI